MSITNEENLEQIRKLLQQSVAIQLYINGCTKEQIRKHLRIADAAVIEMLKGVKIKQENE